VIDRRQFLTGGSAAVLGLASLGNREVAARTVVPFRVPLPMPRVLQPERSDTSNDYYQIVQRETLAEILPGVRTRIWGYNGSFPGPTIEARRGRTTVVTHTNHLGVATVVHLHGGVTTPESDGFPTDTVAPGETRSYRYDNTGRAATLWYHDHSWRDSARNQYMGLAGFYLLKEDSDVEGRLPHGEYDIPLMITDRAFTGDGQLEYDHDRHHGVTGTVVLVNGAPWPVMEVAARRYRLRILNASNATPLRLALNSHQPLVLIATDQGLLPMPVVLPTIGLAPAERIELVVDFSSYPIGSQVVLQNRRAEGLPGLVMRFDVVRAARDDSRVADRLSDVEPLQRSQATRSRTFVFGGTPTLPPRGVRWEINGASFDPHRVDADPRLGDIEVWRFINRGFMGQTMLHPVHTHLVPFQVLTRNGRQPLRQERGWKDTVAIDEGEEVEIIMRWNGYRGRYLLHCHNVEHEDHSMMARVDVV
jgi:spore coat protein A, manganese oxidase